MPVQVKICGIRDREVLESAVEGGAAAVGFVFVAESPRRISPDAAARLSSEVPPGVLKVGLFVNAPDETIGQAVEASALDALQLHGRETPERVAAVKRIAGVPVIKALGISTQDDAHRAASFSGAADMILFDARPPEGATRPGGNARAFDWQVLSGIELQLPWILSGGLTPANVGEAVARSGAAAVDVSSGIERAPGEKDEALIVEFLAAARAPVQRPAPVLQ